MNLTPTGGFMRWLAAATHTGNRLTLQVIVLTRGLAAAFKYQGARFGTVHDCHSYADNLDLVPPLVPEVEQVLEALPHSQAEGVQRRPRRGAHRWIGMLASRADQRRDAVLLALG